jgi:hypothetical protein
VADVVVLTDPRIPGLYRKVWAFAGIPAPPSPATAERFVVRAGAERPELFAELLEEALVEDAAEVTVWQDGAVADYAALGDGGLAVQAGAGMSCPFEPELRAAVSPGRALLFAVEQRDATGRLLGVTWAAVPEREPPPTAALKAAVMRVDAGGFGTATLASDEVFHSRFDSPPTGPGCPMHMKPDQATIDTAFHDPTELAAQAAATRSAASCPKDEDKTADMRPLSARESSGRSARRSPPPPR